MERQRKRELRNSNVRAWAGDKDVFPLDSSLDSSLKKNTAFIRRLRTAIAGSAASTFLQEIRSLSLHKYLSEIISACAEGLSKLKTPSDVAAGVEIFSALHQRFGPAEFTGYVAWHIGRGLSSPDKAFLKTLSAELRDKEEKERIARHRILLRIATESWLVGVLRSLDDVIRPEEAGKGKENVKGTSGPGLKVGEETISGQAEPFPLEVLKELTAQDNQHANLPMLVQYVKIFSWDILGKKMQGAEEEGIEGDDAPLLEASMQQRFKNVLTQYYEGAIPHLKKDQSALNSQSKRNAEAYVRSGEIFEDRQANYEKQVKAQEKFVSNMQSLADALELDMPDLREKDAIPTATDSTIGLVKVGDYIRGDGDGPGIWEDEDEKRFYENIIDLKDRVPGILLDEPKKKKAEDEQVGKRNDEAVEIKPVVEEVEKGEAKEADAEDQSIAIANRTVGAQVDAILARLPQVTSKEAIDEIAYDFCFVNSKASRNRLIKAVQEIPRGRSDLLPLYSRLVTTLGKYMTDVSQALVSYLDDEFRSLQRRKQKDSLAGVRMSNIRYLAELTKFGLVPEHVIFHCLKVSLDDFSRMNIEVICNLLENCGRYLLRNPETAPRMKSFLEILQRKKAAQHLGQQERMLIENASYYVNPPERAAIQQKERTPIDLFVRKLMYVDLTKRNVEKIAKQIRKLHWEEEEVVHVVQKVFCKPQNIKYSNIQHLAIVLSALNRYHPAFVITVIDDLLENITLGLEMNDFKFNQIRLAEVRYLGELYIYKQIDSSIIFDTLFKILTFGYGGYPRPGMVCPIDLPDDFFRIRLVCSILETCGMYYEKGAAKKKLDFFLTFFQYYIKLKETMPMDIEFVVQDAYGLVRPQWKIATNLEEAGALFAAACQENYGTSTAERALEVQEPTDGEDMEEDGDRDGGRQTPAEDEVSSDEDIEANDDHLGTPPAVTDDDEEEHIVVTRPAEDELDPELEADFERELAKMMSDSMDSRKSDRKAMPDIALPIRRAPREMANVATSNQDPAAQPQPLSNPNMVKFSLLSKRGNRPQTRDIDLPADSNFAIAMRSQQEAERAEQQRIKALVLNYDLRSGGGGEAEDESGLPTNGEYNNNFPTYISSRAQTFNTSSPFLLERNPNHARRRPRYGKARDRDDDGNNIYPQHESEQHTETNVAANAGYLGPNFDRGAHPVAAEQRGPSQGGSQRAGGTQRRNQMARRLQLSDVDWT